MRRKSITPFSLVGAIGLLTLLFLPAFTGPASAKPVVLKAVSFLPVDHASGFALRALRDRVNKTFKGELAIQIVGGPEAIPAFEQPTALKGGVMDMALLPDAYFMKMIPETFALSLSRYNAEQERERGLVDFLQGHYEKANIHYLGRASGTYGFYICTTKLIDSVEGLKGLKVPASPIATPAIKSLGMVSVDIEDAEIWTALDRGVIGGTVDPPILVASLRWYERLKYIIDHPFYNLHTAVMMNLGSWKKLSQAQRQGITDLMAGVEKDLTPFFQKEHEESYKEIIDGGVKHVRFSEQGRERFMKTVYGAYWGAAKGRMSQDSYDKLRQLLQ